ncbi:helix-turn-helix transcriptional regulator [Nigerium massiliense]|uniref:helix-turn-helix transcriptional regulator n=1 Tax=Nigerium massiliense TaxID=1522317 RepID=UPI000694C17C|nr:WYL domain-containing protein [Nigerium massiliense]
MGMTSGSQVPRLLALVPYLQQHPDADLRETAARFGVTERQLVADLKVLWFCGLPGGMPGDLIEVDMDALDQGRIRLTNAEFLDRPLRLSVEEAMTLIVALRALEEASDPGQAEAVRSARAKLEGVFGAGDRVDVRVAAGESDVRAELARAIADGRAVRLGYHGASRGMATRPVVDPARVSTRDGYGYLSAWAHEREAWRTYRLDRIVAVEVLDEPAVDHGPVPAEASGWLDERPDAAQVTLELAPAGHWIVEYHPMVSVERLDDDVLRATLLVADPAWFRRLLLRLGPAVRSVEPPEAAASAVAAAREALESGDAAASRPRPRD